MICPNCSKQIRDSAAFCEFCGAKIEAPEELFVEKTLAYNPMIQHRDADNPALLILEQNNIRVVSLRGRTRVAVGRTVSDG
ncbi:MAG: zinc ribbon domain-containing protein, partial [Clostridia bacterium]|nr:zinc ribbon domain-containing protein [Clostridia bacterium]